MTRSEDNHESRIEELVEQFDRLIDRPESQIDSGELSGLSDEEIIQLNRRLQCLDLLQAARPSNSAPDPNQTTVAKSPGANEITPGPSKGPLQEKRKPKTARALGVPQLEGLNVLKRIGSGGYGDVFLAHDPQLDRYVALKVPRLDRAPDKNQKERFAREAKAAAMLSHPAIIPLFQSIVEESDLFLVYAYAKGPSLTDLLESTQSPFDTNDSARLVARIAEAIQHAHIRGVIHRDLKPGNLLFWNDVSTASSFDHIVANICVADFGLARVETGTASITIEGDILGTPSYMSPEQASADDTDHRSDVFSLGVILYELLVGQPPFARESALKTIRAVVNEPTRWPKDQTRVDRDIRAICEKCLEKQPRYRYQSAQDLADDLNRFIEGVPIAARSPSTLERSMKWFARNRLLGSVAIALALSLVIGFVVSTILGFQSMKNARTAGQNEKKWQLAAAIATENEQLAIQEREQAKELLYRARLRNYGYELSEAFRLASSPFKQDAIDIIASSPLEYRDVEHNLTFSQVSSIADSIDFDEMMIRCCVTPDNRTLVTLHESGFSFFDLAKRTRIAQLKIEGAPTSFQFAPHQEYIATIMLNGEIAVFDLQGEKVAELQPNGSQRFDCLAFDKSEDSLLVGVSGNNNEPILAKWKFKETNDLQTLLSPSSQIRSILVDDNSNYLVVATTRAVLVVTQPNYTVNHRLPFFVPNRPSLDLENNRLLVAHADRQVTTIDLDSGKATLSYRPHASTCRVTYFPKSDRIASWDENGKLCISDATYGEPVLTIEASNTVLHECFVSKDDRALVVVAANGLRFLPFDSNYPHAKIDLQGNVHSIHDSTDEDVITTIGSDNRLRNSIQITQLNWRQADPVASYYIEDLHWRLPAVNEQGTNAYLVEKEKVHAFQLAGSGTSAYAEFESEFAVVGDTLSLAHLGPEQRFLYVAGKTGVHRIDLKADPSNRIDASFLLESHATNPIQCCAIDIAQSTKKLACGFADGQVVVFDENSGDQLHRSSYFPDRAKSIVSNLSFSPDGTRLVVNYSGLGVVILDTEDDFKVIERIENGGSVSAFSNHGRWLAIESRLPDAKNRIEIYESQSLTQLEFIEIDHFGADALWFSRDDRWLISGSGSYVDSLRIWNLDSIIHSGDREN